MFPVSAPPSHPSSHTASRKTSRGSPSTSETSRKSLKSFLLPEKSLQVGRFSLAEMGNQGEMLGRNIRRKMSTPIEFEVAMCRY